MKMETYPYRDRIQQRDTTNNIKDNYTVSQKRDPDIIDCNFKND